MKYYLQCFKLFFFSTSIFFIMFAFMITPTHAGSMKGWVEATFSSMDSPLIKTMDLYNSQGFVLADAGKDFAVFSYEASRIDDNKRGKNLVQTDLSLVLYFTSCAPTTGGNGWLEGNVNLVSVKNKVENSVELVEEYIELIKYTESFAGSPKSFGVSKIKKDQVFMSWVLEKGGFIEIQLNQNPHQLVYQFLKECKKNNATK